MACKRFEICIDGAQVSTSLAEKIIREFELEDDFVNFLLDNGLNGAIMRVYEDDVLRVSRCIGSI